MTDNNYLKERFSRENPLRAIGKFAGDIEKETEISVVRCNVGDPTGPTKKESNQVMSAVTEHRSSRTGYTSHTGHPSARQGAAMRLNQIARLPKDTFTEDKTFFVPGGTGGLNVAVHIFEDPVVIGSDPYYPPWIPITESNEGQLETFPFKEQKDYLLDKEVLRQKLLEEQSKSPDRPLVLLYHWPHNPTGKVLSEKDAEETGKMLNELVAEFPQLNLIQEDLYLATTRADLAIHTPLKYLDEKTMKRTILIHSPSKEGHGQDRGAVVATTDDNLALKMTGKTAFSTLGISTAAQFGTVRTLTEIAEGLEAEPAGANKNDPNRNHRYVTADYYQERVGIVGNAFLDLEKAFKSQQNKDVTILPSTQEPEFQKAHITYGQNSIA